MNKDAFDDLRQKHSPLHDDGTSGVVTAYNRAIDAVYEAIQKDPSKFGISGQPDYPDPLNIPQIQEGTWEVPLYFVNYKGLQSENKIALRFCRGLKDRADSFHQEGFVTQALLQACVNELKSVNVSPLSNRETSLAITHIEEAINWLEKRQRDRIISGTQTTSRP